MGYITFSGPEGGYIFPRVHIFPKRWALRENITPFGGPNNVLLHPLPVNICIKQVHDFKFNTL